MTAFCIGPFGGNERTWKPFNPILGETFELDVGSNVRFLAEQACGGTAVALCCCFLGSKRKVLAARRSPLLVFCFCKCNAECLSSLHTPACCCQQYARARQVSHHPPIAAAHAENERWVYDIVSAPTTKFLGNSVDIYPVGAPPVLAPRPAAKRHAWTGCNNKTITGIQSHFQMVRAQGAAHLASLLFLLVRLTHAARRPTSFAVMGFPQVRSHGTTCQGGRACGRALCPVP